MDEAKALLEAGEPQVESHPEEHAKFLCKKGQVCHLAGDAEGARAALVQAQGMAAELKVTDDSELGQAVAALAALLGEGDPDGGGGGPSGDGSPETQTQEVSDEERELALIEAERLMELGHVEYGESRYAEAQEVLRGCARDFSQACEPERRRPGPRQSRQRLPGPGPVRRSHRALHPGPRHRPRNR